MISNGCENMSNNDQNTVSFASDGDMAIIQVISNFDEFLRPYCPCTWSVSLGVPILRGVPITLTRDFLNRTAAGAFSKVSDDSIFIIFTSESRRWSTVGKSTFVSAVSVPSFVA